MLGRVVVDRLPPRRIKARLEAAAEHADTAIRRADGDRSRSSPGESAPATSGAFVLPRRLRDYAGGDSGTLRWRAVGGGIRQVPLPMPPGGASAQLLWIPAGEAVPEHGHCGFETTLVLAGSFYDRNAWYRRGDMEIVDTDIVHRPVAGPEEACICLAVTEAPLRFRAIIPVWSDGDTGSEASGARSPSVPCAGNTHAHTTPRTCR